MIDGITILNQTEIMASNIPSWLFVTIILVPTLIGSVIAIRIDDVVLGIIVGIILFLVGFGTLYSEEPTGRYKYECLIDESVSITEVYGRYEIVEQRGDIWVLEDKINDLGGK